MNSHHKAGQGTQTSINFEEGRIRVMTPVSTSNSYGDALTENGNFTLPGGKSGALDYFIMDYQKNVRMILTEETHSAMNVCTMETGRASAEDPIFGQPGGANEVETTRFPTPSPWSSNSSVGSSVSRLGNLAGHTLGPNVLQKVMAGDQVSAQVQYYYDTPPTSNSNNLLPALLSSLAQGISGGSAASSLVKGNSAAITSQLNGTTGFVNFVQPTNPPGTTPQAYLTILFFDERFNFISEADGGAYQQQVASSVTPTSAPLALTSIKAPKNGYVYVYVSNRSDQDVYFDNLKVGITAGNIIEENHYYAYGLKIAAISSRKLGDPSEGKLKNPYQYNDKEMLDEDADLNWYDYGFRNYDPQIGRFMQLDPLTDDYPELTPFQFAGDEPVGNVDLDGLEPNSVLATASSEAGNAVIIGQAAGQTVKFIGETGRDASVFETTLQSVVIATKIPSKVAASAIKPILTISARVVLSSTNLIDNVVIGKPSVIHEMTLEQKEVETLVLHDQIDPNHPLIKGKQFEGAVLYKDGKGGFMWGWVRQSIEEDNGFWMMFMPLPKIGNVIKGLGRGAETGIALSRRLGLAGEDAVGILGPKIGIRVGDRTRIPDRLTASTLEEVKNVKHLSFTRQLRDFYEYSQRNGLQMILHTRSTTTFSKTLQKMINNGQIIRKIIPGQ